jgi:hypothetical protein
MNLLDAWFWRNVRPLESGCWEWAGERNGGYGRIRLDGRWKRMHRLTYELLIGPFPNGLISDHLCRNRWCVNPLHLEPVTYRENALRGIGPTAVNARATHCLRGHPFDEANTIWRPSGGRDCRACRSAAHLRLTERRRQRRSAA